LYGSGQVIYGDLNRHRAGNLRFIDRIEAQVAIELKIVVNLLSGHTGE
jgi:hypothetical protein